MPDILIRGIGLPKGETAELNIRIKPDGTILNHVGIHLRERAIELPPHGDLIDMDAILNAEKTKPIAKMMMFGGAYVIDLDVVRDAPVVVPAERREG